MPATTRPSDLLALAVAGVVLGVTLGGCAALWDWDAYEGRGSADAADDPDRNPTLPDAVADAGVPFCARVDASFCADFDENALTAAWPLPATWSTAWLSGDASSLTQDPSLSRSRPYSLASRFGGVSGSQAQLVKEFQVPSILHLEFDAYASPPPMGYFVSFVWIILGGPECGYNLILEGQNDGLGNVALGFNALYACNGGSGPEDQPIPSVALGEQWQHFILDATFAFPEDGGTGSSNITVRLGSATSTPIFQSTSQPPQGALSVAIGVMGYAPWAVNYDNVVIDVH